VVEHAARRGAARLFLVAVLALGAGLAAGWLLWGRTRTTVAPTVAADTLYTCGMHPQVIQKQPGLCPLCQMELTPLAVGTAQAGAAGGKPAERRVRYWRDAASEPPYVSAEPGTSPAGRALVPVYAEELAAGDVLTIDPRVVQNMGVRTARVERGAVVRRLRLPGVVWEPEPAHHDVTLRVSGWIEKLFADTDGMHVLQGAPLFELASPELAAVVEELIAARRAAARPDAGAHAAEFLALAQRRLAALGLAQAEIERLAALEAAPRTLTIASPIAGHVIEKEVVAGSRVEAGQRILRLADRTTMWVDLALTAATSGQVHVGDRARLTVDALPGRVFEGPVSFVHPHVDPETRAALARIVLPNADWALQEGMFAMAEISAAVAQDALLVPREAVIDTGARQIAFVVLADGSFEPTRVRLGAAADGGLVQVLEGLAPGERVVTSGQFLLDSESRIREGVKKFLAGGLGRADTGGLRRLEEPEAAVAAVDAVLAPYLQLVAHYAREGEPPAPFDALSLVTASQLLVDAARGPTRSRAEELRARAWELLNQPTARQRQLLRPLSEALIAILRRAPSSQRVYLVHCPHAPGSWLSERDEVQNPYYADAMKRCGTVEGVFEAAPAVGKR